MKAFPLVLLLLLIGLFSCSKNNENPDKVISKWHEVKLRLYQINNDTTVYDTTYYHPFTGLDYIQFNSNGTCVISRDYNYFPNLPAYPKMPQQITPNSIKMDWVNFGAAYVITEIPPPGPPVPGIAPSADTAFLTLSDTLRFQIVGPFHTPASKTVSEAYYLKN